MDVLLAQNETVVTQIKIPATPFTKSQYQLTTKRLVAETRHTFFGIIPTSKSAATYPLKNIAGVEFRTGFALLFALFGAFLALCGLMSFGSHADGALLCLLFAVAFLFLAFPGYFVVANNAGQKIQHVVWVTGRRAAREFVQTVNRAIVEQ